MATPFLSQPNISSASSPTNLLPPSSTDINATLHDRYSHRCVKTLKQIRKLTRKQEKDMTKANKRRRRQSERRQLNVNDNDAGRDNNSSALPASSSSTSPASVSSSSSDIRNSNRFVKEEKDYSLRNKGTYRTLNDLRGIDLIKEQILERIVYPFSSPRKASILNIKAPRGLLLIGKPGIGKTVLADAIVNEIRRNGVNVKYYQETGSCLSKYVGETEKRLRDLFRLASSTSPSIIFFDEMDGLGGRRRSGNNSTSSANTVLNTLLSEINTLRRGSVLLIAATNCPQHCDPALIRKGRFDITINIPLPNSEAREQILQHYFHKNDVDLKDSVMNIIKTETEGFTGSDLEYLAETVQFNLVRRAFPQGSYRNMTRQEIRDRKKELVTNVEYSRDVKMVIEDMKETQKGIEQWKDEEEDGNL